MPALTPSQLAQNRKDIAAGKKPRHGAGPLFAPDQSMVDTTYGFQEQQVIGNLRSRLNQLETALIESNFLTSS